MKKKKKHHTDRAFLSNARSIRFNPEASELAEEALLDSDEKQQRTHTHTHTRVRAWFQARTDDAGSSSRSRSVGPRHPAID